MKTTKHIKNENKLNFLMSSETMWLTRRLFPARLASLLLLFLIAALNFALWQVVFFFSESKIWWSFCYLAYFASGVLFMDFVIADIEVTQAQVQHDYNAVKEETMLESRTKPFLQVLCDLMSDFSCQPRSQDSVWKVVSRKWRSLLPLPLQDLFFSLSQMGLKQILWKYDLTYLKDVIDYLSRSYKYKAR